MKHGQGTLTNLTQLFPSSFVTIPTHVATKESFFCFLPHLYSIQCAVETSATEAVFQVQFSG